MSVLRDAPARDRLVPYDSSEDDSLPTSPMSPALWDLRTPTPTSADEDQGLTCLVNIADDFC